MGIQIPYNGQWVDVAASSADKLTTARHITLTGDVEGDVLFNGTGNAILTVAVNTSVKATKDSANNNISTTYLKLSGGTMTGNITGNITGDVTGSSGSCTGNAATATKLLTDRTNYKNVTDTTVVGQLMWKNYGNSHTIFDASNSTTPTGVACDNTNSATVWSPLLPTLMGYNGSATYGVRVDSARISDTTSSIAGVSVYTGATVPTITTRVNVNGYLYATRVYNAVLNDYAECFETKTLIYKDVLNRIVEVNLDGDVELSNIESDHVIGIVSDNYGILLGGSEEDVSTNKKIPIGLAGVLMVDSECQVNKDNIGKFICSGNEGKAKVSLDNKPGTIVGKIIGINIEKNQYKILVTIR